MKSACRSSAPMMCATPGSSSSVAGGAATSANDGMAGGSGKMRPTRLPKSVSSIELSFSKTVFAMAVTSLAASVAGSMTGDAVLSAVGLSLAVASILGSLAVLTPRKGR